LDLARAQLDAAEFLMQPTGAGPAKSNEGARGSGSPLPAKGRRMQQAHVTAAGKAATVTTERAPGAASVVCECALLGLWAEARDVYERAAEAGGAASAQARLQSEILAQIRQRRKEGSK
jgi:hypothetical protein